MEFINAIEGDIEYNSKNIQKCILNKTRFILVNHFLNDIKNSNISYEFLDKFDYLSNDNKISDLSKIKVSTDSTGVKEIRNILKNDRYQSFKASYNKNIITIIIDKEGKQI